MDTESTVGFDSDDTPRLDALLRTSGYVTKAALDRVVDVIDTFDGADVETTARLLEVTAAFLRGEDSVPSNLFHPEYEADFLEGQRKWIPWLAGNFGVGAKVRPEGSRDPVGATCVGVRSGRVILQYPDHTLTLKPQQVEGKV
jgi:hypothetical protein